MFFVRAPEETPQALFQARIGSEVESKIAGEHKLVANWTQPSKEFMLRMRS